MPPWGFGLVPTPMIVVPAPDDHVEFVLVIRPAERVVVLPRGVGPGGLDVEGRIGCIVFSGCTSTMNLSSSPSRSKSE